MATFYGVIVIENAEVFYTPLVLNTEGWTGGRGKGEWGVDEGGGGVQHKWEWGIQVGGESQVRIAIIFASVNTP